MKTLSASRSALFITALLVSCTVLGLAGIDLVLPAIPALPNAIGGDLGQAQLVLASFAAGTGVGLLLFGELGASFDNRRLLALAMLAYGLTSLSAVAVSKMSVLITLRLFQGIFAACAAVVTPGIVRALFDNNAAIRALGVLGSIESLTPAFAPVVGLALLAAFGWSASFWVTGLLALTLSVLVLLADKRIPRVVGNPSRFGYLVLLRNPSFQRYALSQGCGLGALLVFVFAMPAVFVVALKRDITDFIVMQVSGIAFFILAANLSGHAVERFGAERVIRLGATLALLGCLALLTLAFMGVEQPWLIWLMFLPFNFGFGLRGPPTFFMGLQASNGDDARASALIILYVMLVTAGGTAAVAPFITLGMWPAALTASLLSLTSLALLGLLPAHEQKD